jgi:hypothetical protein
MIFVNNFCKIIPVTPDQQHYTEELSQYNQLAEQVNGRKFETKNEVQ